MNLIFSMVLYGLLLGFLCYSSYFVTKVSKGLSVSKMYDLVYLDPIDDELLFYTFYNLFWCRMFLYLGCLITFLLGVSLWLMQ